MKLMVGFLGVMMVLVAVVAALGLLSYGGVTATLIIIEVIPFLVLAVGVDNLFILVHSYEVCMITARPASLTFPLPPLPSLSANVGCFPRTFTRSQSRS